MTHDTSANNNQPSTNPTHASELISTEFLGWKHDFKRYSEAALQLFVFSLWIGGGICFGLWFTIWEDTDRPNQIWADILRAASVFMLPTVVCLFIAFAFFPYTGINPRGITDWDTPLYFRWTTRGTNPNLVRNVISKSFNSIHKFGNFFIEVCTETSIDVPSYTTVDPSFYRDIVLPPEYETPLGSKFKARALHYGAMNSHAPVNAYIVHLDEESVVTEELLLGIREFISHNKGYIGQGIITYARESKGWQSWVSWIMDAVRVGDDYGRFRMQFLIGRVLVGMKGSFMVVPNQMELESGFDHGPHSSITEDAWFAFCYVDKIRFCPGRLVEQSPFNLMDVVKQRRRWASGLWKVVGHHPTPWYNKAIITLQMITWLTAPLNFVSVVCGFALSGYKASLLLSIYNGLIFGMFNFQYWWGVLHLRSSSYSEKILALILVPFMLPFFVVIEGAAGYLGTFLPDKGFELVQKEQKPIPVPPKVIHDDDKFNTATLPSLSIDYMEPPRHSHSSVRTEEPRPSFSSALTATPRPSQSSMNGYLEFSATLASMGLQPPTSDLAHSRSHSEQSLATFASVRSPTVGSIPGAFSGFAQGSGMLSPTTTLASPVPSIQVEDNKEDSIATTTTTGGSDANLAQVGRKVAEVRSTRDIHLDGFRGFCALIVVAHHVVDCTFGDVYPDLKYGKLQIFWKTWALQIFFLLTGRVLATNWLLACSKGQPNFDKLASQVFRRPFRLLLPTMLVIFIQWKCARDGWFNDANIVLYNIMGSRTRGIPSWGNIGRSFYDVIEFLLQMASGNVPASYLLDLSSSMWAMWILYVGSNLVFFVMATYPFLKKRKWIFLLLVTVYMFWVQSLLSVFLIGVLMAELHRMGMFQNIYSWPRFWNYFYTLAMIGAFLACYWSSSLQWFFNNWSTRLFAKQQPWLMPVTNYIITPVFPTADVIAAIIMFMLIETSVIFRGFFSLWPLQWLGKIAMGVYLWHELLVQMVTVRVIKHVHDSGYTNYSGLCAIFFATTYASAILVASFYKVAVEDRLNIFVPWLHETVFVKPWSFKHFDSAVVDHIKAFPRILLRWLIDVLSMGYFGYILDFMKSRKRESKTVSVKVQ